MQAQESSSPVRLSQDTDPASFDLDVPAQGSSSPDTSQTTDPPSLDFELHADSDESEDLSGDEDDFITSEDESSSSSELSELEASVSFPKTAPHAQPPLFQESRVSVYDFNVAFMMVAQRHNLTYASQSDLLKLTSMIIPVPNLVPSSSSVLRSKFVKYKEDTIVHHYCGHCTVPLMPGQKCAKQECIDTMEPTSTFVELPLDLQIKEKFQGMGHAVVSWEVPNSKMTVYHYITDQMLISKCTCVYCTVILHTHTHTHTHTRTHTQ